MPRGPVRRGHPLLRGALARHSAEPPGAMTQPEPSRAVPAGQRVNGLELIERSRLSPDGKQAMQLSQLAQLRKQSLLSEDEYEAAKARLLET